MKNPEHSASGITDRGYSTIVHDIGLLVAGRRRCSWCQLLQVRHAIDFTEKYRPAAAYQTD